MVIYFIRILKPCYLAENLTPNLLLDGVDQKKNITTL